MAVFWLKKNSVTNNYQITSDVQYLIADKEKLDSISIGANLYVHPTTHPATMITNDNNYRVIKVEENITKSSATDSGNISDISITDDYVYICVKSGIAGEAIWKKFNLIHCQ